MNFKIKIISSIIGKEIPPIRSQNKTSNTSEEDEDWDFDVGLLDDEVDPIEYNFPK